MLSFVTSTHFPRAIETKSALEIRNTYIPIAFPSSVCQIQIQEAHTLSQLRFAILKSIVFMVWREIRLHDLPKATHWMAAAETFVRCIFNRASLAEGTHEWIMCRSFSFAINVVWSMIDSRGLGQSIYFFFLFLAFSCINTHFRNIVSMRTPMRPSFHTRIQWASWFCHIRFVLFHRIYPYMQPY